MATEVRAPSFDDVLARYVTPHRLRTRATGTMFTVQSHGSQLVVTPQSGIGRVVAPEEFRAAWPFIERDEPKAMWQSISKNTSYLESIHDDLVEGLQLDQPVPAFAEAEEAQGVASSADWEARYREQRRRFAAAYRKLESDIARRDKVGIEVTRTLRIRGQEVAELRELLTVSQQEKGAIELSLGLAREEIADLQRDARASAGSNEHAARLQGELTATRSRLIELKERLDKATRDHEASQADAQASERRIDELEQALAAIKSRPMAKDGLGIGLGELASAQARVTDSELVRALESAAQRVVPDPDASVAECRRILERCARGLWQDAHQGAGPPRSFYELMADLRGLGAVPDPDWHLMKNLYARASAIVHEGGARPDVALWIWLGTAQVAELREG
ncbi:MAG: hypothetical protein KF809_15705 [Chloroflexi bacterium]|nr:hypothetical protein [Chloroflexota bacterium]